MSRATVDVPLSVLLDPDETAATKVVWIARRLDPAAGPSELEARTGLTRPTVLSALGRLKAPSRQAAGPRVAVPVALLADRSVGAQAKVLYGVLQAIPGARGQSGRFTYASLCEFTKLNRNTLKGAVADLSDAGWIRVDQANRLQPLRFTLGTPELRRGLAEAAMADRRLKRAEYGGEAIMQEFLSLLIDSDRFTDNARPGFLINPLTGERLELDRYYLPDLAFEFHGEHHFRATERISQKESEAQRLRDLIKAGLCVYEGIHLVVVRAKDLSLQGMLKKVGKLRPIRDLTGHEPLIDVLEDASIRYWANTPK